MHFSSSCSTALRGEWTNNPVMSQRTDRSVRPNADRHFIGTLERVIRRGKRVLLTAPEGESVWVDPAAGIFMADRAQGIFLVSRQTRWTFAPARSRPPVRNSPGRCPN